MLLIGDRVVLRANAPPEAEYILFEIADIELRSSEPGRVREHGYQTTVERARARLRQAGATPSLARECATAMHPVLSKAYARGAAARHVAPYLGPLELFQADHYDAIAHTYRGAFIDLAMMVADLAAPPAAIALQALFLSALLEDEADETTIFLSTEAWTKQRKPGERTHRRPNVSALRDIRTMLSDLAGLAPKPDVRETLPRADVIAFVRARADAAADDDARALYASLERAITVRELPDRGPLADPTLWAIETRLDAEAYELILEAIEEAERSRGRTPGTTYLRARASLALRLEPPKLIAERISALALSMTSFQELSLLAAEAWLEAGDARRAMPYARDLVDAPGVDEGLLLRAKRLLARAVGAAPETHKTHMDSLSTAPSQRPAAMPSHPPSLAPPVSVPDPNVPRSFAPARSRVPTQRPVPAPPAEAAPSVPSPSSKPPARPAAPPPALPQAAAPSPFPAAPNPRSNARTERDPEGRHAQPRERVASSPRPPPFRPASQTPTAPSAPPSLSAPPPPLPLAPPPRRPQGANVMPSTPPPPLELDLPGPDAAASFTLELPGPPPEPPPPPPSLPSGHVPDDAARPSFVPRRRSMGVVQMESRAPPKYDPRAEPEGNEPEPTAGPPPSRRPPVSTRETLKGKALEDARRAALASHDASSAAEPHSRPTPLRPPSPVAKPARSNNLELPPMRPPMPTPVLDADLPPSSTEAVARTLEREKSIRRASYANLGRASLEIELEMHGASLPPFRLESPAPLLPSAPVLPRLTGPADELAEHLALPAGLGAEGRSIDALPKSVLEARVAFTMLARELGLDYRLKRGIELRADVSGIEAMQSVLLETFPDHTIRTAEDAYELRRHGALLSEILARRLDAEWLDISPNELGYWAMIIPPDTRVWPFGRVARLVEMGHKERDLVSYFFELQSRIRRA
jgi:hypothetical protein